MRDLKGMVLAAGLGVRLRPLTERMPKALVRVAGRPMIHYPLLWLKSQGVRQVVINTHYLGGMIEHELGQGSGLGLCIHWSREDELLGTGGGAARASRVTGFKELVLINADTLVDASLASLFEMHRQANAAATMALVEQKDTDKYTPVMTDEGGLVRSIGGMPENSEGQGGLSRKVFAGLSIIGPEIIGLLPPDRPACLVRHGIVPAIEQGKVVAAYGYKGYWRALDTAAAIERAEDELRHSPLSYPLK